MHCTLKLLRLQVKNENSRDVFIAALFFTSHLTADPVDAVGSHGTGDNESNCFRSTTFLPRLWHAKITTIR